MPSTVQKLPWNRCRAGRAALNDSPSGSRDPDTLSTTHIRITCPSHWQVQCKFCNERPSGSFKATSLERLKWTKDEKQWCHRSCLEKSEQDYQQYIVVSSAASSHRPLPAPPPVWHMVTLKNLDPLGTKLRGEQMHPAKRANPPHASAGAVSFFQGEAGSVPPS